MTAAIFLDDSVHNINRKPVILSKPYKASDLALKTQRTEVKKITIHLRRFWISAPCGVNKNFYLVSLLEIGLTKYKSH